MWIFIVLVHLFALGYVLSGQSCSQYTETMTDAIAHRLPRVAPQVTHSGPAALPHSMALSRDASTPAGGWDACLMKEARGAGIHPSLLRAMVQVESGGMPYAFGWYDDRGVRQQYRTTQYVDALMYFHALQAEGIRFDVGLVQVNSTNLPVLHDRIGIAPTQALNPCDNLKLSGYILREKIRQHGRTWNAIARYNGIGPQTQIYAMKVRTAYCHRASWDRFCHQVTSLQRFLRSPLPVHPI